MAKTGDTIETTAAATEMSAAEEAQWEDMRQATERSANEAWADPDAAPAPAPPETAPVEPAPEEWKTRAETAERNYLTLEQRTNALFQRAAQEAQLQQQRQQAQNRLPDPTQDPIGHLVGRQQVIEHHIIQREQAQQQQAMLGQQLQAIEGVVGRAKALEKQFESETRDYGDAVLYLGEAVDRELETVHGVKDPAARTAYIQAEGIRLAAQWEQAGLNPAAKIYEMAQLRGYRAGRGSPSQSIQRLQQGHQQARSLSSARGSGPRQMSVQTLLEASDDEFAKLIGTKEGMALLGA